MRTQEQWKNLDNWESHYWITRDHAHRDKVIKELKGKKFNSVLEVGCACGPMLKRIYDEFKCEVYGIDISPKAIETGKRLFPEAHFQVGNAKEIPFDRKFDLVITDAVLIYFNRADVIRVLSEIKRVGKQVLFMEMHNEKDGRSDDYFVYNYNELLSLLGFKNIKVKKILNYWGGPPWGDAHIITAET